MTPPPLRRIERFLAELRRRKVYRAAGGYLVLAVGALEILDVLVPTTRLPDWSGTLFLSLAILGFPMAAVAAWMFDITPDGVRRTAAVGPGDDPDTADAGNPDQVTGATAGAGPDLDRRSVAVLPFRNLSGTPEAAPFAAGLHDDLLTELSKISALTIISRTSVATYAGSGRTVPSIARELGVGTVVEGAVQQADGRVRLNVQLIDGRTDVHLWADRYDRELTVGNIFDIQSELARKIASTLEAALTPDERARMGRVPTEDLDAYRLYAQGRALVARRTEDDVRRALDCFRKATQLDPGYAQAWAGLADALVLTRYYDYGEPGGGPTPEEAARRALELDPHLAEAYTSLGILHAVRQEGLDSIRELTRATERHPGSAEAWIWLGWIRLVLGRPDEALEASERAVELDPLAPAVRTFSAEILMANGHHARSLEEARRATGIHPEYGLAHFLEGIALYHLGRYAEAGSTLDTALSLARARGVPRPEQVRALAALCDVRVGRESDARLRLERILEGGDPYAEGLVLAALGETEEAFRALASVSVWGSPETEMVTYLFPSTLDPLRRDPRWEDVRASIERSWGVPSAETRGS